MRLLVRSRRGSTVGNTLVVLSLLSLVFAVIYPRVARVLHDRKVSQVIAAVEVVRVAAEGFLDETGAWPPDAPEGTLPAALVERLSPDFPATLEGYALDWHRWETVYVPETPLSPEIEMSPPPSVLAPGRDLDVVLLEPMQQPDPVLNAVAGITVRSGEDLLLASLLSRFGGTRSFVRGDSWTLMLLREERR